MAVLDSRHADLQQALARGWVENVGVRLGKWSEGAFTPFAMSGAP